MQDYAGFTDKICDGAEKDLPIQLLARFQKFHTPISFLPLQKTPFEYYSKRKWPKRFYTLQSKRLPYGKAVKINRM